MSKHSVCIVINHKMFLRNDILCCCISFNEGSFRGTSQYCLHPQNDFPRRERFDDVIVCPDFKAFHPVVLFTFCGEHDDRGGLMVPQTFGDFDAVHFWHHEIEEYAMEILFHCILQCILSVICLRNFISFTHQVHIE